MSDRNQTFQFLRFHVAEGSEAALLGLRQESLETCEANYPGFRGAFLVRLEGGDWLDITVWDADGHRDRTQSYPPVEARGEFFAEVDGLLGDETGVLIASFPHSSWPRLSRRGRR